MMNVSAEVTSKKSPVLLIFFVIIVLLFFGSVLFWFFGKNSADDEVSTLRNDVLALQTDVESKHEQYGAMMPDVHRLKEDLASLKSEYLTALQQIETLDKELDDISGNTIELIRQEVGYNKVDFDGLFERVNMLASKIEAIEKTLAVKQKTVAAKTQAGSQTETVSAAPARIAPPSPPFDVIGVESRGSEYFLAVAPKTARSLSEIKLFREHDTVVGAWVLKTLEMDKAIFSVHGRKVTLAIN